MINLTIQEIEELVCFFQDYYNDEDSKYVPSYYILKEAIEKIKGKN